MCGISLTSGQLFNELFPDCTRSCFSQVVSRRRGGDRICEMRCLFVGVGPNALFIVLPYRVIGPHANPPSHIKLTTDQLCFMTHFIVSTMQAGTTPIFNLWYAWTRIKPTNPLGQCWVPPIVTFYDQQGLLRTYSSPGSSIRSPHPGCPQSTIWERITVWELQTPYHYTKLNLLTSLVQ